MTHTADTCTIETHDHFGQFENFQNGGTWPPHCSDELICNDCGRNAYYDRADERYHHLIDPERGCFLIPPEIDGVFVSPWPPARPSGPVSWSSPSSIVQQEHR